MAKTYQNKQIPGGQYIKDTYDLINDNSNDLDLDLTTLFSDIVSITTRIDQHVTNLAEKHTTDGVINTSDVLGTSLSDALETLKSDIEAHIASLTAHASENITVSSSDPNITATDVLSALEQLSTRVSNIIAQSGTSDTEVVDARLSSVYGSFADLVTRLNNSDVILDRVDNELNTPDPSDPITEFGTHQNGGTVYKDQAFDGQATEYKVEGRSVVQLVDNGDVESSLVTDGNRTPARIENDGTISNIGVTTFNDTTGQVFNLDTSKQYYMYAKISVGLLRADEVFVIYSDNALARFGANTSDGKESSVKFTPTKSLQANLCLVENNSGNTDGITKISFMFFELDSEDELLTADQLKEKYASNGYLPTGLNHVDGKQYVTGKNLFDKSKSVPGKYVDVNTGNLIASVIKSASDYIKVIAGVTYKSNYADNYAFYDVNKTFLSGANGSTYTPAQDGYIRATVSDIDTFQLEIGTTATDYKKYLLREIPFNSLKGLPNSVTDEYDVITGVVTRNVGEYILTADDITNWTTTGTNVHWVAISKANLTGYIHDGEVSSEFGTIITDLGQETRLIPFDDVANIEKVSTNAATGSFLYIVEKNKYTDLNDAKTQLTGKVITFQLATPYTEQGESIQPDIETGGIQYTDSKIAPNVTYKVNLNAASQRNANSNAIVRVEQESDMKMLDTFAQDDVGAENALEIDLYYETLLNQVVTLIPSVTNTGACTISINNKDAVPINKVDATGAYIDLVAGDIVANKPIQIVISSDKVVLI